MPVTTAAISLVDALFAAAVRNAVLSDSFSPHLRREVLWLAGGYVLDVWIGFNEWKYLIAQRRFEIGIRNVDLTNERYKTMSLIPSDHFTSVYNRRSTFTRESNNGDTRPYRRSHSGNVSITA